MQVSKTLMIAVLLMFSVILNPSIAIDRLPGEYGKINSKQLDNLRFACEFGKGAVFKGDDLCFTFAAISWVETRAGMNIVGGPGHQSFGLFQNYVKTVSNRLKQQGVRMSRNEIKEMLLERDGSAYWAEVELFAWLKHHKGDLRKALASYNAGYSYQKALPYADKVLRTRNFFIANNNVLKIRQ